MVNHKRTFNIECTEPDKSVGFNLCDREVGRYFWKLCVLQHTFYIKFEKNQNHSSAEGNFNIFQNLPDDLTESRDNLFVEQPNLYASDSHISTGGNWQTDSVVSSNMSLAQSQQQIKPQFNQNWATPMMPDNYNGGNSNWGLVGSNVSLNNRAQSSSCLDLSNNNISNQDKERLKAFLPGYRSAPDYETAVQQKKYRASESELRMNTPLIHLQPSGIVSDPHINIYSGSQPDVHRVTAVADAIFGQQLQQYPDVTQTTNGAYQQHFDSNVIRLDGLSQQLQMMRFNKPPPPYPANRLSSTSTPDLALASHRALCYQAYVSGSSPDLVSTRTFLNSQYAGPQQQPSIPSNTFRYRYSQSHIPHGTYENLNFLETQTKTNLLSQKMQKAYDGPAYRMSNQQQQQQQGMIGSHQLNGSIEPIYENVPLPNQSDVNNDEMRDRASSIQSAPGAPGVMRFKQQQQQQHQQHQTQHQSQQQPTLNDTHNFNVINPSIVFDRQPDHVPVTKAQSNPMPHQVFQNSQSHDITDSHPAIVFNQHQTSGTSGTLIEQNRLNRSAQFDSLNRSQSTNVLDSSQSSSYTNTTTTTDSGINCSDHRNSKEKKKRRWNFWGGSKSSLNEKQKSATLGRDKEKNNKNALTKDEESNLRHRWSTGLPRLPLLATISKEKLVSYHGIFGCVTHFHICFFFQFASVKFWKQNSSIHNFM